jgi:F0F1-type ATP synthase assembly protein I
MFGDNTQPTDTPAASQAAPEAAAKKGKAGAPEAGQKPAMMAMVMKKAPMVLVGAVIGYLLAKRK